MVPFQEISLVGFIYIYIYPCNSMPVTLSLLKERRDLTHVQLNFKSAMKYKTKVLPWNGHWIYFYKTISLLLSVV